MGRARKETVEAIVPRDRQRAVYQLWSSNTTNPPRGEGILDEQPAGDQTLGGRPRLRVCSEMTLGIMYCHGITSLSPSDRDPSAGSTPKLN